MLHYTLLRTRRKGSSEDGLAIAFTVGLFLDAKSGGSEHYA